MLLACATDTRYARLAAALIASVSAAHPATEIHFVVLGVGLDARTKKRLGNSASGTVTLEFLDLDRQLDRSIKSFASARYISATAYCSMLLPGLLVEKGFAARHKRLLILDCDMIVRSSLEPLYAMDLDGRVLGAALMEADGAYRGACNAEIGRDPQAPYFNSGTLIVDLEAAKEARLTERCVAYASESGRSFTHHDQAVLNAVAGDEWTRIDRRWNFGVGDQSDPEFPDAVVLHYKGRIKPIHTDYRKGALEEYLAAESATPWRGKRRISPVRRSFSKKWMRIGERLARLGLQQ